MNFFKVLYAVFCGVFLCLLVFMVVVFCLSGILPAVFVGLCALLVLCLFAFCSWMFDYRRKTMRILLGMYQENKKLRKEMEQMNSQAAKREEKLHEHLEEIARTYRNIMKVISYGQEGNEGYYSQKSQTADSRQQYGVRKNQEAPGVRQQSGFQKSQTAAGSMLHKTQSLQDTKYSMQLPDMLGNSSHKKTYSVKAEIKGKSSGQQPGVSIYRDGAGAFRLTGKELIPAKIQKGDIVNKSQHDEMKAYDMFELFEVNSRQVAGHKIARIEPAVIYGAYDLEKNHCFEGKLFKKGKIEVEDPVSWPAEMDLH